MADARAAPQPSSGTAPVRAVAASVVCLTASILPGFLAGALGSSTKEEFGLVGDAVSPSAALVVSAFWALAAAALNLLGRPVQSRSTAHP